MICKSPCVKRNNVSLSREEPISAACLLATGTAIIISPSMTGVTGVTGPGAPCDEKESTSVVFGTLRYLRFNCFISASSVRSMESSPSGWPYSFKIRRNLLFILVRFGGLTPRLVVIRSSVIALAVGGIRYSSGCPPASCTS